MIPKFLEEKFVDKTILIEKPLFNRSYKLKVIKNSAYIGYNLRFHPMIKKIKQICKELKLWSIYVFCGSYLPDWRPGRDYRNTASAKQDSGGGVLLDLSHELDYLHWLVGSMKLEYVYNGKVSNLDIDTDDLLIISSKTKENTRINISLNYFTRKPIRQIVIDGENISIQADLITNSASVYENNKVSRRY